MEKRVRFQTPKDVTPPGLDGVTCSFSFTVVDASLLGKPEEEKNTEHHNLVVSITNTRRVAWNLSDQQLIKVLFEFGRRDVEEKIKTRSLQPRKKIILTITNTDAECPYDPSRIKDPDGYEVTVEAEKNPIGFH